MTEIDAGSEQLPSPVRRYLEIALGSRRQLIKRATLRQTGTIRNDTHSSRWLDFAATHEVAPIKTEFQWTARIAVLPLVHIQVRDAYIHGGGTGRVKLMSLLTLAHKEGGEAMNSGSLHRYLAEAVWYPTALLPSSGLRWTAIGENKALATLTHVNTTVSLEFRFNQNCEVIGIFSPGRWGLFDGGFKQVPWEGHFSDYEFLGGMLIPRRGEVGWHIDGEWRCVWKGRITDASYIFSSC